MMSARRILVINPNSSIAITAAIDAAVARLRMPGGPAITVAGLDGGPPGIATQQDAGSVMMPLVRWVERDAADAFVLACISDCGLHAVRAAAPPWASPGGASCARRRWASSSASSPCRRPACGGSDAPCNRWRSRPATPVAVPWTSAPPTRRVRGVRERLAESGRSLMRQRGADVFILGSAGMASHRKPMEDALGCPALEPSQQATAAVAALRLADA